jgi:hypothetical protein
MYVYVANILFNFQKLLNLFVQLCVMFHRRYLYEQQLLLMKRKKESSKVL